jgi:hypothetical protein
MEAVKTALARDQIAEILENVMRKLEIAPIAILFNFGRTAEALTGPVRRPDRTFVMRCAGRNRETASRPARTIYSESSVSFRNPAWSAAIAVVRPAS